MGKRFFHRGRSLCRRQEGAVAVEFALVITLLLLIVGGVIDFGHYLYLRHVATNASREGARFGAVYSTSRPLDSDIAKYISDKYSSSLGYSDGSGPTVTITKTGTSSGSDLTVTVTADKQWFLLDYFIKSLPSASGLYKPAGVTVMKLE